MRGNSTIRRKVKEVLGTEIRGGSVCVFGWTSVEMGFFSDLDALWFMGCNKVFYSKKKLK